MHRSKGLYFMLTLTVISTVLSSCRMKGSYRMSDARQQRMETAYDSLKSAYGRLISQYDSSAESLSPDLRNLYAQMQQMHGQMDLNHRQMISMNMGRHVQGNKMMAEGMAMDMQNHMTGEWYEQMMSMHERMATLHEENRQPSMAKMNRHLSQGYERMMKMIPGLDEPSKVPFNEKGNPSLLNGKALFLRNCASCHGSNALGIAGVFPPLVNSEWVTGDKSVPIRILLNGLTGEIEVDGRTYQGIMPSFKARLSAAGMVAILNYVRSLNEKDLPKITQDDVIRVGKTHSDRTRPWEASELRELLEN